MQPSKQKLREKLQAQRLAMNPEEIAAKSQIIAEKLLAMIDWPTIHDIHIYASVPAWREIDTSYIKKIIKKNWPHINISSSLNSRSEPLPTGQYDLIIVPVLGFDRDNYRLGLGAGWYDRFLANQPNAQAIGLAYAAAKLDYLPRESHDKALDKIITDL